MNLFIIYLLIIIYLYNIFYLCFSNVLPVLQTCTLTVCKRAVCSLEKYHLHRNIHLILAPAAVKFYEVDRTVTTLR